LTNILYVDIYRHMKTSIAIEALSSLAQPSRLEAFRLLVRRHPHGMAAGEIARQLDVPHNTMSTHLAILNRSSLISVERQGRSMVYRADLSAVRQLLVFLLNDCCNGQPELCAPLVEEISKSCSPSATCCG
jgi:ArsR family transcriptional regulator, arsenate/arsenite/antimonite-responsive transcriptional repressor